MTSPPTDIEQHCSTLVAQRLITCDLPRPRKHLTPETIAWEIEQP